MCTRRIPTGVFLSPFCPFLAALGNFLSPFLALHNRHGHDFAKFVLILRIFAASDEKPSVCAPADSTAIDNRRTNTRAMPKPTVVCVKCSKRNTVHRTAVCDVCRSNAPEYRARKRRYEGSEKGRRKHLISNRVSTKQLEGHEKPKVVNASERRIKLEDTSFPSATDGAVTETETEPNESPSTSPIEPFNFSTVTSNPIEHAIKDDPFPTFANINFPMAQWNPSEAISTFNPTSYHGEVFSYAGQAQYDWNLLQMINNPFA
ncbi:hypothetical protein PROFUN_08567 [Planoprotostelium fungivorum]|uniref:Uncharacterized protein n=1 Tax=Planoprotostelium fungivorum TaxID=1890364 RepID=A0A2P6N1S7_9EUKA|nr:hypothetical protein PROFUN_08567 [Planoprotostelium fungivorum]